jgi:hypothetical protein
MVIDMPASFPSSVKTWANKQDNIDDVFAGDINGTYHEIIAIENELMQVGYKPSARVATTQNGDLATAFANGQTVDGIVLSTGDRILIKDQTSGAENGIYIVNASGAPSRAIDANTAAHMGPGLMVYVREGAVNGKGTWKLTTTGTITLGTTPLTFENELASHKADFENLKKDFINMAQYVNCLGDGVNYDDAAFQHAVNNYKVVLVPEPDVYYRFEHKVSVPSDTKIIGLGLPYIYNDTVNAEPVFEIVGTAESRLKNVKLKNLKIRNGTASAGDYITDKDGIKVKYCDGFKMTGCEITEIQGENGVSTRYSTNINVKGNKFYRATYSHFSVLPECENIHVEDNIFDTTTSLTTPDTYLFMTGGDYAPVDSWACKNLWIKNNKFLNNPRWEGIDSHGVENVWIEDNYIENVKMGIMVGAALSFVSNIAVKNVHILRNAIKQGTGGNGYHGIIVKGDYNASVYCQAEGVNISDNDIDGFGASDSSTVGAINIYCTQNATVERNRIKNFKGYGIVLTSTNYNFKIKNNTIMDAVGKSSGGISVGIASRYNGNDGEIEDNQIGYDDILKSIDRGITIDDSFSHVRTYKNKIMATAFKYTGEGNFNVLKATTPTAIVGTQGDIATDANDMPKYYCTDPVLRFSTAKTSGITLTGTAGSNELTIASGDFNNLLPGMEIVIAGAGAAGAALTTTIIKLTNTKVWVKANISTSITGAAVTYTNAAWVAL